MKKQMSEEPLVEKMPYHLELHRVAKKGGALWLQLIDARLHPVLAYYYRSTPYRVIVVRERIGKDGGYLPAQPVYKYGFETEAEARADYERLQELY